MAFFAAASAPSRLRPNWISPIRKIQALTFDGADVLLGLTEMPQFQVLYSARRAYSLTRRFSELPNHDGDHDKAD
jgi:hypothetical protein